MRRWSRVVGGAFQIYMDPLAEPGHKGADDMRFLALQPKKMLSFDWNAPPHAGRSARSSAPSSSCVSQPVGDKQTRITLHHTGWGDGGQWDQAYQYFDKAWGAVLVNLQKRFDKGPQDWSDWMAQLKAWHEAEAKKKAAAGK